MTEHWACQPLVGQEVRSFDPPTLAATTFHRRAKKSRYPMGQCRTVGSSSFFTQCPCYEEENPRYCRENDPLIISLGDQRYEMTNLVGGVEFDLDADGDPQQVPWTATGSDEAFLVLDRNGNGIIDDGLELFGDVSPQHTSPLGRNGFEALGFYDDALNGGNEDGQISAQDSVFVDLLLWTDGNHNGYSEGTELKTLADAGILWIALDYRRSNRVDKFGNEFRYFGSAGRQDGSTRPAWDVFLVAE